MIDDQQKKKKTGENKKNEGKTQMLSNTGLQLSVLDREMTEPLFTTSLKERRYEQPM